MECSCIRGDGGFNIHVENYDGRFLFLTDYSDWYVYEDVVKKYVVPDEFTISIRVPSFSKASEKSFTIKTGVRNKISLGDDRWWPDGIYCFSIDSCTNKMYINRLIIPKINCCVKQYASYGTVNKVKELQEYIENAHIAVHNGDNETAEKTLIILNKEISLLNCNCQ